MKIKKENIEHYFNNYEILYASVSNYRFYILCGKVTKYHIVEWVKAGTPKIILETENLEEAVKFWNERN